MNHLRLVIAFAVYVIAALIYEGDPTPLFLGIIVGALLASWGYELEKAREREKPPLDHLTHRENVRS